MVINFIFIGSVGQDAKICDSFVQLLANTRQTDDVTL